MEDNVFGAMTFKRGWVKQEQLHLWGADRDLKIRVSAYPEDKPTDVQKKAYESFIRNLKEVSEESLVRLAMFVVKDSESGLPTNLEKAVNELLNHVKIQEILFFKDGSYAIECDVDWTEDGVSVLVNNGKMETGYSDELLGCRI